MYSESGEIYYRSEWEGGREREHVRERERERERKQ